MYQIKCLAIEMHKWLVDVDLLISKLIFIVKRETFFKLLIAFRSPTKLDKIGKFVSSIFIKQN